jgi:hypothetical protein
MTGTATLSNNYTGMPAELSSRVPALSSVQYGGETVETLAATLRVKHGNVSLSGAGKVGQPDQTGGTPAVKETMDGVYVSDGWSGSAAEDAVFSDNGFHNAYDLEDADLTMPNLDDPFTDESGIPYPSYMDYLQANALVINGDLQLQTPTPTPLISSGHGSIALDAFGNLQISGIVYVKGDITIGGSDPVLYDGRGTLVSEGSVSVGVDLYSKGQFPTDDVLGVISHTRMHLGTSDAQLKLAGAFFAQEEVENGKQNHLAGSIVSNSFGMTQVPDLYQVPALSKNLPPGMPGADDVNQYAWRRVPRSWVELD